MASVLLMLMIDAALALVLLVFAAPMCWLPVRVLLVSVCVVVDDDTVVDTMFIGVDVLLWVCWLVCVCCGVDGVGGVHGGCR